MPRVRAALRGLFFFIVWGSVFIMSTLNLTPSTRKFIRLEKARIRRQFFDVKKQEELISQLYKKFTPAHASQDLEKPVAPKAAIGAKAKVVKKKKEVVKTSK